MSCHVHFDDTYKPAYNGSKKNHSLVYIIVDGVLFVSVVSSIHVYISCVETWSADMCCMEQVPFKIICLCIGGYR